MVCNKSNRLLKCGAGAGHRATWVVYFSKELDPAVSLSFPWSLRQNLHRVNGRLPAQRAGFAFPNETLLCIGWRRVSGRCGRCYTCCFCWSWALYSFKMQFILEESKPDLVWLCKSYFWGRGEAKITLKTVSQMKFVVPSLFIDITPAKFTFIRASISF